MSDDVISTHFLNGLLEQGYESTEFLLSQVLHFSVLTCASRPMLLLTVVAYFIKKSVLVLYLLLHFFIFVDHVFLFLPELFALVF
jgi:hypothetical protein